jgi:hypothetical protein
MGRSTVVAKEVGLNDGLAFQATSGINPQATFTVVLQASVVRSEAPVCENALKIVEDGSAPCRVVIEKQVAAQITWT